MVLVNESFRPSLKDPGFTRTTSYNSYQSINTAMNPELKDHDVCSWRCHNRNRYCKPQLFKSVESYINPLYFGLISFLYQGGSFASYGIANIFFLVLLWPFVMVYLLIKSLDMQQKIKNLKA